MKKNAVFTAALACLSLLASCDRADHQTTLKLGHTLDTSHSVHQAMLFMDERLRELSGGTMKIDIYPNGQLGSERDAMELLQIGSLALTKVSASPMESFVPEMKIFSVPYVFRNEDHLWDFLEGEKGRDLLLSGQDVWLRGLVYFDAGSRSFYTTEKAIRTPDDLKGLKIRVMNSATSIEMVQALGGAATPIPFGEVYTALQQGVVDGAENNPPSFQLTKHYDVARYYTLDMHTNVPDILLMSQHVWDQLNAEQQGWVQEAARLSVPYQRALWAKSTEEAIEAVKADGVEVIHPDKAAFMKAVQPMHESYRGTPLYDLIQHINSGTGGADQ